jgi:ATP-dependent Clp protease protease subunit
MKENKSSEVSEIDDILDLGMGIKNNFSDPYGVIHTFYLTGVIEDPDNYITWFRKFKNATPNDIIYISINSGGGDLNTCIQLLKCMEETDAKTIASIDGVCCSAATMVFLAADEHEVGEHSMFMAHNYSGGFAGKGNEMFTAITFEKKWLANFYETIYFGFLEYDEIQDLINDKDIYLNAGEVRERLEKRKKLLEAPEVIESKSKKSKK